jgi:hypothetical protein
VRGTFLKALVALAGLAITVAAVASAVAPGPAVDAGVAVASRPISKVPAPLITRHPDRVESGSVATFAFQAAKAHSFQCRVDARSWRACRSPVLYRGISVGRHRFRVRALVRPPAARPRAIRHSRTRRFVWRRAESRRFSIVQLNTELGALYPGAPPTALPLRIENPNDIPILVTSIAVASAVGPSGCDAVTNLELIPSNASDSLALRVPAGGSVSVPSAGIAPPAIRLRDLPVNQDACQGARFELSFSGSAHG